MKSVFLWSEDEARQHRKRHPYPRGLYLTLEQAAILTRPIQSVLFGFGER